MVPGGPNAPDPLRLLAAGSTDIAYTSIFPFLDAVKLGNDFVLVGAQFQSSPLGIISLPKKPIRTAADIPGKKILTQGVFEKSVIDATLALNKVMASWAAESSRDPLMLLAATGVLSLVATIACALPAWRASGIDPMKAIRYE